MDSLTQIALGIATAHVVAGKSLQRKTFLYGAIVGTIPDLDVLVGYFMLPVDAVKFHRGISHSLFFMFLASPLLGWVISVIERKRLRAIPACYLVFTCLFTHVVLDLFTAWGTQIFWPNTYRVAFKTIFVVDPLYTIPLVISLVLAWRCKQDYLRRNRIIWKGIVVSSVYLMITCGVKVFALSQFEQSLHENQIQYSNLIVKPTAFNCIVWNANVSTNDGYLLADYSLFDSQPISFRLYKKDKASEKILLGNPDFETLKEVSEGWYTVSQKDNVVYFNDLRFGLLDENVEEPQFAFSYVFKNEDGKLVAQEVPKQSRQGVKLLRHLISRIKGN